MKSVAHLLLALTFVARWTTPAAAANPTSPTRPNIVFVLSDDQSAPYVGCYGYPIKTPHLDQFAREGMRFERAFTTAPQCVPSRISLMSSRSPQAARVGRFTSPLPREVPIFPELLRAQAGYYTGVCRRNHHIDGWTDPHTHVTADILTAHHMYTMPERMDYVDISGPGNTGNRVNAFLDRVPAGKPFFLWVNFNDPHHPWTAPRANDPASMIIPPDWPDLPELRDDLARHCDEITRLDSEFQLVMDILQQRGLRENTVVIFMGDNGMALPNGKGSLHERGLHVPLIVSWPGKVAPNSVSNALISGEDLGPTLLAIAGVAPDPHMTGVSFLPVLRDANATPRTYVFGMREPHGDEIFTPATMSSGYDLGRSVRDDRYKLIINYTPAMNYEPVDSAGDPGWQAVLREHRAGHLASQFEQLFFTHPRPIVEFYDLKTDPYEMHNLDGNADVAAVEHRLKLALQEKMVTDYDFLPLPLRE